MGCTASKLNNEDTVLRCKERRGFMKEAVYARHHLAAAHSDYCRSLRITGSALTAFAAGEPLAVSDHSPAILLPNTTNPTTPRVPSPPPSSLHTPPQQQPSSATRNYNLHRTKTPIKLPHILSESSFSASPKNQQNPNQYTYNKVKSPIKLPHVVSESSISSPPKNNQTNHFNTQKKPKMKLPHILSDSSISSIPKGQNTRNFTENYTYNANATYSSTPSQASSVWNWENFYPPSPPDSEFFNDNDYKNHQEREINDNSSVYSSYNKHNPDMETASKYSNYEKKSNNHHPNQEVHLHNQHRHSESEGEEEEEEETETEEREEVQCSEWGDHYSTTTSSSDDEMAERESRSEVGTRSNFGSSVHSEAKGPPFQPPAAAPSSKSDKFDDDAGSSVSWNKNNTGRYENEISDMKIVVRHRDLAEIVAALKEYFDKAASAGEQVSEMLETDRAQLDRSFGQLKKTVYHSSGVLSNLSSSWTSKPPLAVKYRFDPGSMDERGSSKSLCSTLERLLAWEKKLYQEVKAREGVKIEHEKKLSTLQSQEYRGDEEVKLDKTKASIKRLQSLILVTSQAVSTTSSAINGLRDDELVQQLVELCRGFMYMWRSMNQFHEVQNHIVQQVQGLVNRSTKGESTSDLHRQATRDLESAVSAWHSCFCRLIKFQRDFICSLHGWFKLSLIPVNSEPVNDNRESSEALSFCDEWKLALDRVPDTVASEAIKSFINVVHSISMKQAEELKIKKRTESASKELERKASSLRNIEKNSLPYLFTASTHLQPSPTMALKLSSPAATGFKGLSWCPRTKGCILSFKINGVHRNTRQKISCAIKMTAGESGEPMKVKLGHLFKKARKVWDSSPQPVKSFPWNRAVESFIQLILDLILAVIKYLSVPMLAVTSLSEMSYCAHEKKLFIVPIPLLVGVALAGILKETALELSPLLKDAEVPWHLISVAIFFTLIKLLGPYYPYWGRILVPHFANGGLLRTLWFAVLWYKTPKNTAGPSVPANDSLPDQTDV